MSFRNVRIDVVDTAAPIVILGVSAPEAAAQPTDSLTLYASAIDLGSGVESIAMYLDCRVVATASNEGGSCTLPYIVAQSCPIVRLDLSDAFKGRVRDGNLRGPDRRDGCRRQHDRIELST